MSHEDSPAPKPLSLALCMATLGVVYGDIGTSPLYAFRECFHGARRIEPTADNILGILSLVFWALIVVISLKYMFLILRADNEGEGGILALMALVHKQLHPEQRRLNRTVMLIGLFGAALLYGDGVITPAISVLSAMEGLEVVTPAFDDLVIPLTIAILIGLFYVQSHGTQKIGVVFGPVMVLWFGVLSVTGVASILNYPGVLAAMSPHYTIEFFWNNGTLGFFVLGIVFLVVTGGEALYADMGHFGKRPIRVVWFAAVLPALVLNYFGQGALVLSHLGTPEFAGVLENPFYKLVPHVLLIPLVMLATLSTVVASQAVISGAFSLTMQAVHLGLLPRVKIRHTSQDEFGQIYIPFVNFVLLVCTLALVLGFRESGKLASAYGLAVTATMVITTVLAYLVMRRMWHWPHLLAAGIALPLLVVDLAFLGANLVKIPDGGWFPLSIGLLGVVVMTTWRRGRDLLGQVIDESGETFESFFAELDELQPARVPGTVLYLTGSPDLVPRSLIRNVKFNKTLHAQVAVVSVEVSRRPHIPLRDRLTVEELRPDFFRIVIHYGYAQRFNVPVALAPLHPERIDLEPSETVYVVGGEMLKVTNRPGMALWREELFAFMMRNASPATLYFRIPPDQVIEIGKQVDI